MALINSLDVAIGARTTPLTRALKNTQGDIRRFSNDVTKNINKMARLTATAFVGVGAGLAYFTYESFKAADSVFKNARSINASVKEYQGFLEIFRVMGIDQRRVVHLFQDLSYTVNEAARTNNVYRQGLQQLGLDVKNLIALKPADLFWTILQGLQEIGDLNVTIQQGLTRQFYKRSSKEAGTLLGIPIQELKQYATTLERLGGTFNETEEDAEFFIDQIGLVTKVLRNQLDKGIIRAVKEITSQFSREEFESAVGRVGDELNKLGYNVIKFVFLLYDLRKEIGAVILVWAGFNIVIGSANLIAAISSLVGWLAQLGSSLLAMKIGTIITSLLSVALTALIALVPVFIFNWDRLGPHVDKVLTGMTFSLKRWEVQFKIALERMNNELIQWSVNSANFLKKVFPFVPTPVAGLDKLGESNKEIMRLVGELDEIDKSIQSKNLNIVDDAAALGKEVGDTLSDLFTKIQTAIQEFLHIPHIDTDGKHPWKDYIDRFMEMFPTPDDFRAVEDIDIHDKWKAFDQMDGLLLEFQQEMQDWADAITDVKAQAFDHFRMGIKAYVQSITASLADGIREATRTGDIHDIFDAIGREIYHNIIDSLAVGITKALNLEGLLLKMGTGFLSFLSPWRAYHGGGVVPGSDGQESLGLLKAKEVVFTPDQLAAFKDITGGTNITVINENFGSFDRASYEAVARNTDLFANLLMPALQRRLGR